MWSCKPQDWALEATKAYEEASSAVQIPEPPNRVGREANLHWRSPKKAPPQTTISSNAPRRPSSKTETAPPTKEG
ncbi:hypothetical protein Hanom_Chr14g01304291 [Helianthus anomalus]